MSPLSKVKMSPLVIGGDKVGQRCDDDEYKGSDPTRGCSKGAK